MAVFRNPDRDCALCPRLNAFIGDQRKKYPDWHNAPVPAFGELDAELLIVGLAPGLQGANRTGRPFTGDWAGDLLYETLIAFGLAEGQYGRAPDDGLRLKRARITNAVRCVPPENKPTGEEVKACRPFLVNEIASMPNLKAILSLGQLSHRAVLATLGLKQGQHPFSHGGKHDLGIRGLTLFDSYHCSRYNTNTGRLTEKMFHEVFADLKLHLDR